MIHLNEPINNTFIWYTASDPRINTITPVWFRAWLPRDFLTQFKKM